MSSTLVPYTVVMLTAIDGRPRVLAFVRSWHPVLVADHELDAMRAQLRGLGAVLVILSEAGAWSFAPDDDLERFEIRRAALDREIDDAADKYGVAFGCDAVVILDGHGAVRFSHVVPGALPTTLDRALDAAGAALLATPRSPIMFTRREWALTSLCAGFAIVLLGCKGKTQDPPPRPPPRVQEILSSTEYCSYCTSGQNMSVALLDGGHATTDAEVREAMSGNRCRCGARKGT